MYVCSFEWQLSPTECVTIVKSTNSFIWWQKNRLFIEARKEMTDQKAPVRRMRQTCVNFGIFIRRTCHAVRDDITIFFCVFSEFSKFKWKIRHTKQTMWFVGSYTNTQHTQHTRRVQLYPMAAVQLLAVYCQPLFINETIFPLFIEFYGIKNGLFWKAWNWQTCWIKYEYLGTQSRCVVDFTWCILFFKCFNFSFHIFLFGWTIMKDESRTRTRII